MKDTGRTLVLRNAVRLIGLFVRAERRSDSDRFFIVTYILYIHRLKNVRTNGTPLYFIVFLYKEKSFQHDPQQEEDMCGRTKDHKY